MTTESSFDSVCTEQLPDPGEDVGPACESCGVPRLDSGRFCEACGHDHTAVHPWRLEVKADRDYFDRAGSGLEFPNSYVMCVFEFVADEITVGRGGSKSGAPPEVDLSVGRLDPGVSHAHVSIRRVEGGRFLVTDLGSTNGTQIDDAGTLSPVLEPVEIGAGVSILLGAWTVLRPTLH